jgi:hypothetical protein
VVSPLRISLGGGDDAFIALNRDFLVMTTFQSVGLVDGERVPSVRACYDFELYAISSLYSRSVLSKI